MTLCPIGQTVQRRPLRNKKSEPPEKSAIHLCCKDSCNSTPPQTGATGDVTSDGQTAALALDINFHTRSQAQSTDEYASQVSQCATPSMQSDPRVPSSTTLLPIHTSVKKQKRLLEDAPEGDWDVIEASHPESDGKGLKKSKGDNSFACPYYRKNPFLHFDCINRKLNRIQDLKQHLQRRHTAPHFCSTCSMGFYSPQLFEAHVRSTSCKPQTSYTSIESVSLAAHKQLSCRIDRKLTPNEQWHTIWNILFQDPDTTQRPLLGSVLEEALGIIADFCEKDIGRVVSSFAKKQQMSTGLVGLLPLMLKDLFRNVRARIEAGPSSPVAAEPVSSAEEIDVGDSLPEAEQETALDCFDILSNERSSHFEPPIFSAGGSSSLSSNLNVQPSNASYLDFDYDSFLSSHLGGIFTEESFDLVSDDPANNVHDFDRNEYP